MLAVLCAAHTGSAALGQVPPQDPLQKDLAGPYAATRANPALRTRGPIMEELEPLLLQQARYLVSQLHPWDKDPAAQLLTTGQSNEHGIRPNATTALGLAIVSRTFPDQALPKTFPRNLARDRALAILRFVLPTHGAGNVPCADGKPWRNQWQSALWAHYAGQAAWLLWDDLTPEQKWLAARMICDEADRFVNVDPPGQIVSDTKAEENAWNSLVVSLAYNMFPNHPHHAAWRETAVRWILSAYTSAADLDRNPTIDGKPLRDRVSKPNIYDDYTLENHDRVHPDYMSTTTMLTYQVPLYTWAGNPVPEALDFNVRNMYASQLKMTFPDGGWVYPNGQDWHLHRNGDWFDYHASIAVRYKDPDATRMMCECLRVLQAMAARTPDGPITLPSETEFASSQAMLLEWPAQAYLLMAQGGEGPPPTPAEQLWQKVAGKHVFTNGKFAVFRTPTSVSTFSWGRQVMGMVLPLRRDLLLAPNVRGLIGEVTVDGIANENPKPGKFVIGGNPDTLTVAGVIDRGDGALEQRVAFVALPDGRTVYVDTVTPRPGKSVKSIGLGTLGVLNDLHWAYHDGTRTLKYEGGETTFSAADAAGSEPVPLSSPWYNLDGMGIAVLSSSGKQLYLPKPTAARCRLEQLFHLNHSESPTSLKPTVLVFYPAQTADATRAAAARCNVHQSNDVFDITLDDGARISVDLETLTVDTHRF
jgi:hypothetical protein